MVARWPPGLFLRRPRALHATLHAAPRHDAPPLSLCSHHTASTIVEEAEDELSQPTHKVFILGGYGGLGTSRDFFMDVHFLALDTWTWEKVPANTAFVRRAHRALSQR